jgi:hypothetical protein
VAGIHQREEMQVLLLLEQLEKQPIEARVRVPIDEPRVVAGGIGAKVGKLDTLPLARAAPLAAQPAAKNLAAGELESLELGEQLGAQQRRIRA